MKGPLRWALFAWFLALNQPIDAQESGKIEKIRDISPDQKFAALISCSSEPEDPNHIDSNLISAVKLVSLPSKKIVMDRSEEHTSELQSHHDLVCRLLLEKKK